MKKIGVVVTSVTLLMLSGCSVQEVITAEHTKLDVATLGITNFEPGVPEDNNQVKSGVYEEIRTAEARYLPYHIKTTLQSTGYWGAVRVIPSTTVYTDVYLRGEIERSDGEFVTLNVRASDATGREWFENTYSMQTGVRSYSSNRDRANDPYQKVFNDLANDLRQYAATLTPREISQILRKTARVAR